MPPKAENVSFEVQWRPANLINGMMGALGLRAGWLPIRDPLIEPASLYARGYAENTQVLVLEAGAGDIDIRPGCEYLFRVNGANARGRTEGNE